MEPSVAYIVAVHKNPDQVVRLLRRLASDRATFVVHVDSHAGAAVEDEIRRGSHGLPEVRFLERNPCFWGGFGLVRASIKGMDDLVQREVPFENLVLLSGQDYPLRPPAEIEAFLAASCGRSFMTHARLPVPFWPGGGLPRIERWHLVSHLALHLPVPWQRRIPGGLAPFGGGAWLSFSRPVVEHVVGFVRRNPSFVRFFEHALHPSELFFQTIVMNSPLADTVVDEHLHHIDWSADPGPAILRAADFETLIRSDKLFARKFDVTVDRTILDLLDEHIGAVSVGRPG